MSAIRTTCAYCGVGCGISARVTGERTVEIAGDTEHPANRGKLCSKGTHLGETVGLEGRLLHPMIGDGQVDWDEALNLVAARIHECVSKHGPDSVAFYVSGQLLTEDYYIANKLMKGFIGSGNIDTNSRLCMASAVAAHTRGFGEDVVPCTYDDLDAADLILLVGSNTAWCHPVIWQRIEQARKDRGTKIVVIDPRRTETAEQADLHLPIAPDGDITLFNALLAEMHRKGMTDADFLTDRVEMPEGFFDSIADTDPGVPAELFEAFVGLVAENPRMVTLFSQGANQSVCGTDKGNAIINLHLATGRINCPGAGPFSITGQPNAMGGREVGGLASMLACHLGFSDEELQDVAAFWKTDRLCAGPGLKAVDMFRAVHDGRIKFLWVMATNPAVSLPDSGFVREALERCETVVVSDVIADTDTGRFADIRLPALAWGEKDGTVTNSERIISHQRALFTPPGEARADWQIMCDVAQRLDWGEHFAFESAAEVFREYAAMTALSVKHGKVLDLTDKAQISAEDYENFEPFRWGGTHPLAERFPTPTGKAKIILVETPAQETESDDHSFILNTGRYRDQWHTMTRTGLSPVLSQHRREALLEIHPLDAEVQGLCDGGLARVSTESGTSVFRVAISEGQRRGEIFVPMHWTDIMSGEGRCNRLPGQATDPISGQPGFKRSFAKVEPVAPEWRAFLVSRERVAMPDLLYWSVARTKLGWLYELAGNGSVSPQDWLPEGEQLEVADHVRGMRRVAVIGEDGALAAAVYVTRSGELPPRDWIADQLGASQSDAVELLAGRPSTPLPDRGAIVCVCHGIGENEIAEAAHAGASTIDAIGEATCAGTNCGSCRPEIAKLLDARLGEWQEAAE